MLVLKVVYFWPAFFEGERFVSATPTAIHDLIDENHGVGTNVLAEVLREYVRCFVDDFFLLFGV